MREFKFNALLPATALCFLWGTTQAGAQIDNYDTVYPSGAARTILQRGGIDSSNQATKQLKGQVYINGKNVVLKKKHNERRSDDKVRGKTLNIAPGGAAFLN